MTVQDLIEHLKTLNPKLKVLRYDGQGHGDVSAHQLPQPKRYAMRHCYWHEVMPWEPVGAGEIEAIKLP